MGLRRLKPRKVALDDLQHGHHAAALAAHALVPPTGAQRAAGLEIPWN